MNLRHAEPAKSATLPALFVEKTPPQVLVVDDAIEIRNCVSLILRSNGYRVIEAEDGLAAQIVLMIEHPSLVICDLEMPICDGWSLLAYCHAQHPNIPVLVISGVVTGRRPEIECWAAGFVPKPFGLDQLRNEVHRLLSQAA